MLARGLLILALLLPVSAHAAEYAPKNMVVQGSWSATCDTRNARFNRATLIASCYNLRGQLVESTLDTATCSQPPNAMNMDGQLHCEGGLRSPPVGGNWVGYCGLERMFGTVLEAYCFNGAGQYVHAEIDTATCAEPRTVHTRGGGDLYCEAPMAQATGPGNGVATGVVPNPGGGEMEIRGQGNVVIVPDPGGGQGSNPAPGTSQRGEFGQNGQLIPSNPIIVGGAPTATQQVAVVTGRAVSVTAPQGLQKFNRPDGSNQRVVGTINAGQTIEVFCVGAWCQLTDRSGFVSLAALSGAQQMAPQPVPQLAPQQVQPQPVPQAGLPTQQSNFGGQGFDGQWWVPNDPGQEPVSLMIIQNGNTAAAVMSSAGATTRMTGTVGGDRFSFTFTTTQSTGASFGGEGFLTVVNNGAALSGGFTMNGATVSTLTATRSR